MDIIWLIVFLLFVLSVLFQKSFCSSSVQAQSYLDIARKDGRMKDLMHRFEYIKAVKELK